MRCQPQLLHLKQNIYNYSSGDNEVEQKDYQKVRMSAKRSCLLTLAGKLYPQNLNNEDKSEAKRS